MSVILKTAAVGLLIAMFGVRAIAAVVLTVLAVLLSYRMK